MVPVVQMAALQYRHRSQVDFLEISDVREEEADEGEGQEPLRHCADHMCHITRFSWDPV